MTRPTLLTAEGEKKKFPLLSVIFTVLLLIVILFFCFEVWFLRKFTPVRVDGGSMLMTLENDDWLYAESGVMPERGDIVIIYVKDYENEYGHALFPAAANGEPISYIIKRVIGLEGDEVYAEDKCVYLKKRGEAEFSPIPDKFAYYDPMGVPLNFGSEQDPVKVGEGEIFVMGDNRLNSYDSADVGTLLLKDVTGVVPDWAVAYKSLITRWENFRDRFRQ